ncbi:MAG: hypothetical protein ACK4M3_04765 [Pyrobaculum sp.]
MEIVETGGGGEGGKHHDATTSSIDNSSFQRWRGWEELATASSRRKTPTALCP